MLLVQASIPQIIESNTYNNNLHMLFIKVQNLLRVSGSAINMYSKIGKIKMINF